MDTNEAVRRAVGVFVANAERDLADVFAALELDGLPKPLAASVVEFMPVAFGRALLNGAGVHFADSYVRYDGQGRKRLEQMLVEEPIYREALALVADVLAQGRDVFLAVAGLSAEVSAVNQAWNGGSKPEKLVLAPPLMLWPDDLAPSGATEIREHKPWWRFWK